MSEHDADETERAEAEALARALEGRGAAPEEALQTAALLRYSHDEGALSPERADAILAGLDAVPLPKPAPRRSWLRLWLPLGVGVAAAAAVMLVLLSTQKVAAPSPVAMQPPPALQAERAPQVTGTGLPVPDAALLAAQAAAADGKDDARLQAEMKTYRERMLRALEAAYPQMVGMVTQAQGGHSR